MNRKYQEILKLDSMLNGANIPHVLRRKHDGWQVCYPSDNEKDVVMDAIETFGSFGEEEDKLEIMGLLTPEEEENDIVLGHLTAGEVFMRIWYHYHYQWEAFCEIHSQPEESKELEEPKENRVLTPEEFEEKLLLLKKRFYDEDDDEEVCHSMMDDLICSLLRSLGYGKGIDIFESTPKWYA